MQVRNNKKMSSFKKNKDSSPSTVLVLNDQTILGLLASSVRQKKKIHT